MGLFHVPTPFARRTVEPVLSGRPGLLQLVQITAAGQRRTCTGFAKAMNLLYRPFRGFRYSNLNSTDKFAIDYTLSLFNVNYKGFARS